MSGGSRNQISEGVESHLFDSGVEFTELKSSLCDSGVDFEDVRNNLFDSGGSEAKSVRHSSNLGRPGAEGIGVTYGNLSFWAPL